MMMLYDHCFTFLAFFRSFCEFSQFLNFPSQKWITENENIFIKFLMLFIILSHATLYKG